MASFVQNIPVRRLGTGGPLVPALGFGLMGMSHAYETKNKPNSERFAVLDHAIEIGNTFWDTSEYVVFCFYFCVIVCLFSLPRTDIV